MTRTVVMTMASLKLYIDHTASVTVEVSIDVQLFFFGTYELLCIEIYVIGRGWMHW